MTSRLSPVATITAPPAVLPSFAAWQAQRVRCESCAYSRSKPPSLACTHRLSMAAGGRIGGGRMSCIEARDPGKACGPDALLWVPARAQAYAEAAPC